MLKSNINNKKRGQTIVMVALFFAAVSTMIMLVLAEPALKQLGQTVNLISSEQSLYVGRAAAEDYIYRMTNNIDVPTKITLTIGSNVGSSTLQNLGSEQFVLGSGNSSGLIRSLKYRIALASGTSFHFGLQSGIGGIEMFNSSSVAGNVYANGTVVGNANGGNLVKGSVVSAGPAGYVYKIHSTSSIYAHEIEDSYAEGDAYYTVIDAATDVDGAKYPGSGDQPNMDLPITDALVEEWKTAAAAGGTIACSGSYYEIDTNMSIGPKKIDCDLRIKGSTVTLTGPIWVKGNFNANTFTSIRVDPALGSRSVAIIADNPANRITSSKIELEQTGTFSGSGTGNSYILLLSQNNSAENGGSEIAASMSQSVNGDVLLYAGHGLIELSQSIELKEVTAYKINLRNTAEVVYESGLASLLFTSGPGGDFELDWFKEVQ